MSVDHTKRAPRYALNTADNPKCRLTRIDGHSRDIHIGLILNASKTGALLVLPKCADKLGQGERLLLEFEIPSIKSVVINPIQIKRTNTINGRTHYGVEFLELPGTLKICLEEGIKKGLENAA